MKSSQWPGLVTNASPFAIPATAAVEQTNLASDILGQVHVRGGMRKVAVVGGSPDILDCFPYEQDGKSAIISMLPDGGLVVQRSPAYGWQATSPLEPNLSAPGLVAASYTGRFVEDGVDLEPQPPTDTDPGGDIGDAIDCPQALSGGSASLFVASPRLDAIGCSEVAFESAFDGGEAARTADCDAIVTGLCGQSTDPDDPVPPPPDDPEQPPLTLPTAPRFVTARFGPGNAIVSWSAPSSDGGAAVIDYEVEQSSDGGGTPDPVPGVLQAPVVEAWGNTDARVLLAPIGSVPPGTTVQYMHQHSTDDFATVSTSAITERDVNAAGYLVLIPTQVTSAAYRFRVRGKNAVGFGQWSEWSTPGTPTPNPPPPVPNVTCSIEVSGSFYTASPPCPPSGGKPGGLSTVKSGSMSVWVELSNPAAVITNTTEEWYGHIPRTSCSAWGAGVLAVCMSRASVGNPVRLSGRPSLTWVYRACGSSTVSTSVPAHYAEYRVDVTVAYTLNGVAGEARASSNYVPFSRMWENGWDFKTAWVP